MHHLYDTAVNNRRPFAAEHACCDTPLVRVSLALSKSLESIPYPRVKFLVSLSAFNTWRAISQARHVRAVKTPF
jgi:hypothetical protein